MNRKRRRWPYLVVHGGGSGSAQIPQAGLDVSADDLLVENVDLKAKRYGRLK